MSRLPYERLDNPMIDDYRQTQCDDGECDCGRDLYQEWVDEQCVRGEDYRFVEDEDYKGDYPMLHALGFC